MNNNSNENIKEIFVEMIKEVDENSLKSYINSLSRYSQDYNIEFKENQFAIKKLIELKKDLTEKINKLKLTLQESKNTQNFANKLHNTNIKNNAYNNNTNNAQDSSKIASATKQLITYSQKYNISLAYNQIKILDNEIKRYNCQNYDVYHLIYKFYYLTSNNEVRKILEQLAKNFC